MLFKRYVADRAGLAYLFLILIVGIVALAFFSFYFSSIVENVQHAFNPYLGSGSWVTNEHYNVFYVATGFLTNVWTYIYGFIFFGLIYFSYLYTQRRSAR